MTNVYSAPFVWVRGQLYLVASFTLDTQRRALPRLLDQLLCEHRASDILVLRRLSGAEQDEVLRALDGAEVDAWAHLSRDLDKQQVNEEDQDR